MEKSRRLKEAKGSSRERQKIRRLEKTEGWKVGGLAKNRKRKDSRSQGVGKANGSRSQEFEGSSGERQKIRRLEVSLNI